MDNRPAAFLAFALAAVLAFASASAMAQQAVAPDPSSSIDPLIERQVRQLALDGAKSNVQAIEQGGTLELAARAPRIEVSLGQLDPRLRLAPCQLIEPYLPDGTRLWGKSRIGLRCTRGAVKWNVYLPITVKVFAPALVATNGAISGAVLTAADLTQADVDLAEDPSPAIAQADLAVGRVLARGLKPGQSLRQTHLRARQWFAAGETVTISAQGEGFSVAGEGQAMNNGIEGQSVRVRTDSGRVVSGLPVGDRRVELN